MKKVLEDELMSLAHRILKLRNRAEIHELKEEAAILYEKLSVLSFAEKHFGGLKPTITKYDVEKSIEQVHHEDAESSNYPDGTEYNEEQIYEHNTEKIKDIVSQMPYESSQVDEMFEDKPEIEEKEAPPTIQDNTKNEIEDFGVHFDDLPDFEPADTVEDNSDEKLTEDHKADEENSAESEEVYSEEKEEDKPQRTMDLFSQPKKSLNDSLNSELKIGLNDRLSFVKHLFDNDVKSYNEFIERINELGSFEEVKGFLDEQIQNKYAFWKDKEDIANRLLYLIQKKFE
jgi:hypothetical protein